MNKIASILFLCLFYGFLTAQNLPVQRAEVKLLPHQLNWAVLQLEGQDVYRAGALLEMPALKEGPFIAWSVTWSAAKWEAGNLIQVIFYDGEKIIETRKIELDPHAGQQKGKFVSQLYFARKQVTKARLHFIGNTEIRDVTFHFFSPGHSAAAVPQFPNEMTLRSGCECPQPAYLNRSQWCPAGNCPPNPSPSQTNVTHLIVHHSAGTNISSDWAAVVRSIWDFHVNVNLWSDIGYNWLVDPNGVMYEGRGDNILGAHFCGTNGGTMGVCVLGDFTSVTPMQDAVNTLTALLAWKACDAGTDPLGSALHPSSGLVLNNISGHRDGCTTSCPGDSFYPTLPAVRVSVNERINIVCGGNVLEAPTQLAISAVSANNIGLVWKDNSNAEQGYVVERSAGSNTNFTALTTLPANTIAYSDAAVSPNTVYYYRVKAVQSGVSSNYSNEAVAFSGTAASGSNLHENTVSVFPNPAGELVFITVENQRFGKVEILLADVAGRQLKQVFFEKSDMKLEMSLGLENIPPGVYQVFLRQGDETGVFKMVKN